MGRTSDARQRLLHSARDLMATSGYTALGVKEICDHAEVNKGSFYHFFPSKRDLALEVLECYRVGYLQEVEHCLAQPLPFPQRIEELFYHFAQEHLATVRSCGQVKGCLLGNFALELSTLDESIRLKVQQIFQDLAARLEQALRQAIAAGEVPISDPARTAQAVVAYLEGSTLLAKTFNDPTVMQQLSQGAITLVLGRGSMGA